MERLTLKAGLCDMASTEFCLEQKDCYTCPHGRKCFNRLADYEDTGLMPEEIMALLDPPNLPLTLDELRKMQVMEWLWVKIIHPNERQLFRGIKSAYYQIYTDYSDGEALCCGWPGVAHKLEYEGYGKTWLAYRRKPEERTA